MKIILKLVYSCVFVFFKTLSTSFGVESSLSSKRLSFTLNSRKLHTENIENKEYLSSKTRFFSKLGNFDDSKFGQISESANLNKVFKEDKVTITNKQKEIDVDCLMLFKAAKCYKQELEVDDFMLDIFIEDEKNMKRINFKQLGGDGPTDIISIRDDLLYLRSDFHKNRSPQKPSQHYHLGEIFLCPGFIKGVIDSENKLGLKTPEKFEKSLNVGKRYDHEKEEWFNKMAGMEDVLLDAFIDILPIDNPGVGP
eukprot:XP_765855.1 hypothetical protein [Theileria parva strain Muguga]